MRLTEQLEKMTGQESRLTILGHLQRGGTPSAGRSPAGHSPGNALRRIAQPGRHGVMIAARGDGVEPVPLEEVAGKKKLVPPDHPWSNPPGWWAQASASKTTAKIFDGGIIH